MKFETFLPIFAPAPAGMVIAIRLYQEILSAVGTHDQPWPFLAGLCAIVGMIGMIGAEMYAYKQAGIAIAERQMAAAVVALLAAVVCSLLIIWAIGTGANTRPLIIAVIIAIAAYVVLAVKDYRVRKNAVRQDAIARVDTQNEQVLQLERQKTNQANAAVRLAKAGSAPVQAVRDVREQTNSRSLALEKVEEIRAYQTANPTKTVRDVSAACGVSVGSVQKYGVKTK